MGSHQFSGQLAGFACADGLALKSDARYFPARNEAYLP
jgi:hypothetical protein